jgi:hypothetical protein
MDEALDIVQLESMKPAVQDFLLKIGDQQYFGKLATLWVIKLNAWHCHYIVDQSPVYLRRIVEYCSSLLEKSESMLSGAELQEIEASRPYAEIELDRRFNPR